MDANANINKAVFAAYQKCSTKAYLTTHGEKPPDTFFADTLGCISAAYKARVSQSPRMGSTSVVPFDHLRLTGVAAECTSTLLVDCETASYACDLPVPARVGSRTKRAEPGHDYVPILFSAWNKRDRSDDLLVCFGALAIQQAVGEEIPPCGKVIYGEGDCGRTVRIADHLPKTRQIVEAVASLSLAREPPPLILNKHCAICDFQTRCRALAVERENLSLLGGMTAKELARNRDKGISTITQLSYGYRPRRRRRTKSTAPRASPPVRHDHKLKALAIKKAQIHIVGSPSLSIEGTPVFVDVEGDPDRDFYYLIGIRYEAEGFPVEQSFWADGAEGEREIWRDCLRALKLLENPQIVHYGAYERRFLKAMRERWKASAEDAQFLDRLIDGSVNLLSTIYGRIYFPTYSNGLKDIARWLGFEWTWPQASGSAAILMRRCWELTADERLKRRLIAYNIEDCCATAVVAEALAHICSTSEFGGETKLGTANVDSLEVGFQRTFGKFASALPEFEKINAAAYWDYQRSKVYVRTNKAIRRTIEKSGNLVKKVAVDKEVIVDDRPAYCSRCGASKCRVHERFSRIIYDLKFTRRGIRRWAVRYQYRSYRCDACRAMTAVSRMHSKYGHNLRAYIIYLLIEMRLSHQKIVEHIATVFNVSITTSTVRHVKSEMARKYEPTYRWIREQIRSGLLVNSDETKGVVHGGGHYVWIFANLTSVAYVYSSSREASILDEALAGFKGVLVSDFYSGYDAVPCQQQKCLIHLMRDINEDILKHPFNDELTFIATRFGSLLREIVETIDRYGLKKRNLGKHKRSAERFLNDVAGLRCTTEVASALKKEDRQEHGQNLYFPRLRQCSV